MVEEKSKPKSYLIVCEKCKASVVVEGFDGRPCKKCYSRMYIYAEVVEKKYESMKKSK